MDPVGIRPRIHARGTARPAVGLTVGAVTIGFVLAACAGRNGTSAPESTPTAPETPNASSSGPEIGGASTGDLARIERAIRRYAGDRAGRLPVKLEDLTKELSPEGDRYLTRVPIDPWGRPYAYAVVSVRLGAYDLRSYGPDTLPGNDDDLVADAQPVPVH